MLEKYDHAKYFRKDLDVYAEKVNDKRKTVNNPRRLGKEPCTCQLEIRIT